jgi:hypothetical protein
MWNASGAAVTVPTTVTGVAPQRVSPKSASHWFSMMRPTVWL